MKRMFIAAMAIAALVSCSKDNEDVILQSSKKSVAITISNAVPQTKAVPEVIPTANGGVATIAAQENNQVAAEVGELRVLFANSAGNIVEAYSFADAEEVTAADPNPETGDPVNGKYKYTYHAVHESVTQVAVVRYASITDVTKFVGTALSTYATAAAVENDNADLDNIDLYGSADLVNSGTTCNVPSENHQETYTYQLYTADVTVTPALARVEIAGISCTDLGETTFEAATDASVTGGFDELALVDLGWGATTPKYTFAFAKETTTEGEGDEAKTIVTYTDVLKGVYKKEGEDRKTTKRALTPYVPGAPAQDMAIAWNVAPQAAPSATTPMTLNMLASAYDYTVNTPNKTLTITGLKDKSGNAISNFERSKIYRMNINFKESNLDVSNEDICVEVNVTIANWVVVLVEPSFKTE